jgi:hypothetical protein
VREVIHQAQFAPTQASRKVCLLPRAEELTMEAANGLLKVLEEPPRGMVFLFLAENSGDLLPTTVSRSQVVRVRPNVDSDVTARLVSAGYKEDDARYLAGILEDEDELEAFISDPIDITVAEREAELVVAEAAGEELITLSVGSDPIVRRSASSRLLLMLVRGERGLAVSGSIAAARAGRDGAARLLSGLLAASFASLREGIKGDGRGSELAPTAWGRICRRIQRAQRALDRYTFMEGVFLSLFLDICKVDDG